MPRLRQKSNRLNLDLRRWLCRVGVRFLLACVIAICSTLPSVLAAQEQLARLRLKNGEFVDGRLVPLAAAGVLGWRSPNFLTPLEFEWQHVSSIDFHPTKPDVVVKDPFRFLLSNGTCISGGLAKLDEAEIWIDNSNMGQLRIERTAVRQIESLDRSARLVYEGPRSLDEWRSEVPQAWSFQHGAIQSLAHHSNIRCAVQLPAVCFVELRLAWDTRPDFVLSLGVEKNASKDPLAAARLEVWDGQLTIVRESGKNADIAILSKLAAGEGNVELTIYLNQQDGLVSVFSSSGEMLVKLAVPFEQPVTLNDVLVSNGGSHVRIEKLDVYQWDGTLPDPNAQAGEFVVRKGGKPARGRIHSFDKAAGTLVVESEPAASIELADVERIVFDAPVTHSPERSEKEPLVADSKPDSNSISDPNSIDVRLRDGSRMVGNWLGMSPDGQVRFAVSGLDNRTVTFAHAQLATILGSKAAVPASAAGSRGVENRIGQLIAHGTHLSGQLVSPSSDQTSGVLGWKPTVSNRVVAIELQASGAIDYLSPRGRETASSTAGTRAQQIVAERLKLEAQLRLKGLGLQQMLAEQLKLKAQLRLKELGLQQRANGNFGQGMPGGDQGMPRGNVEDLFRSRFGLQPAASSIVRLGLLMRTGDRIDGEVVKIDDRGVSFNSTATTTKFMPHNQIQSIVLAHTSKPLDLSAERLERLLTVPRVSKNDPPTHLLIATNGDYLRGRLLRLDSETATMEVRLEQVELPRKAIAQIVWLHDRNWVTASNDVAIAGNQTTDENPVAAAPLVHAVLSNSDSLTFTPISIANERLNGKSSLLGECSVSLKDLSLLLFGPDVAMRALELQHDTWKLSLARNPKVLDAELADQAGALRSSERAPLVGKPAPDFTLDDLSGKPYQLGQHNGRVIVLDFWASWCGPCLATMPEVARIVGESGQDQVDLVAVNLQETPERVHSAISRLGLTAAVVLDADGETAELYGAQAIPQTVIIDRAGIVRHVFVGGGSKFAEQFHTALSEIVEAK